MNVVQLSPVPDPADAGDASALGVRERNRLARHRTYLRAALHVTFEEGLEALTMQRLAAEVGAAVGTIYTYFPSKGALVAEVQREAIERLAQSATAMGVTVDAAINDTAPDAAPSAAGALAPIAAYGRFWLTAGETFPEEMQLLMLLLSDVTESVPADEAGRVVPAALRMLGLAEDRIRRATAAGALAPGGSDERTIALAAALTGCAQLTTVQRWDPDLLDPTRTGRLVLDSLLIGWGADPVALVAAHEIVDRCTPLAHPLPEDA